MPLSPASVGSGKLFHWDTSNDPFPLNQDAVRVDPDSGKSCLDLREWPEVGRSQIRQQRSFPGENTEELVEDLDDIVSVDFSSNGGIVFIDGAGVIEERKNHLLLA